MRSTDPLKEQIMNILQKNEPNRSRISELNDRLRVHGVGGRILQTMGVKSLSEERRSKVFDAIRSYGSFGPDNDPFGEHDFGEVKVDGTSVMFKIDYYEIAGRYHSPDPSDPKVTLRIMTVMLSDEY